MNNILLCDGNANGLYYSADQILEGDEFSYRGSDYVVIAWPTGELVGIDVHNLDLISDL